MKKITSVAFDLAIDLTSSRYFEPPELRWILIHPSSFILHPSIRPHPYFVTPRLDVWINSISDFTSAESLTSCWILSRA
jgi:hypothetical protein